MRSKDMPASTDAQHIVRMALEECDRLEHPYFGAEHLLLGILAHGEGSAARMLTERGLNLDHARTEIDRIVAAATPRDSTKTLRSIGIDIGHLQRQLKANFGTQTVMEARIRVLRRSYWRRQTGPSPLWSRPAMPSTETAMTAAEAHAKRRGESTIKDMHLLYGLLYAARQPIGAGLRGRTRKYMTVQTGIRADQPHPVRLLLAAHNVDVDQWCTELGKAP